MRVYHEFVGRATCVAWWVGCTSGVTQFRRQPIWRVRTTRHCNLVRPTCVARQVGRTQGIDCGWNSSCRQSGVQTRGALEVQPTRVAG